MPIREAIIGEVAVRLTTTRDPERKPKAMRLVVITTNDGRIWIRAVPERADKQGHTTMRVQMTQEETETLVGLLRSAHADVGQKRYPLFNEGVL